MKRFFDENDNCEREVSMFMREMHAAIGSVMQKWADDGYSVRDMMNLAHGAVESHACGLILRNVKEEPK